MGTQSRIYDIIIWGATGFTGRLVAEYLLTQYKGTDLNWGMAGRNKKKLEEVRSSLNADQIPILVADSLDRLSLDLLVSKTKVICTTVGPYAKYGTPLVASCIANGTDYCDLTGEVQWMRRIIDEYHSAAKSRGVRIVHTCGFDSVPSDMGVFFIQNEIKKRTGSYAGHIKMRVKVMKGGMSGGTYASLNYVMEEAEKDAQVHQTLLDPYGLNPKDSPRGQDGPDLDKVIYDTVAQSWIAPFVMAVINTKVVRRSNALAGYRYGMSFKYDEAMMTGSGITGRVKGLVTAGILGALMAGRSGSIWKKMVDKILPNPGEGPSKKERDNGFFNLVFFCKLQDEKIMKGKVTGDKDPGYGSTSKMIGEAAVCLALDKKKCPDISGVLTPSTALGAPYLKRLQDNAGLTFDFLHYS